MHLRGTQREKKTADFVPSRRSFMEAIGKLLKPALTHHTLPRPRFTVPAASRNAGKLLNITPRLTDPFHPSLIKDNKTSAASCLCGTVDAGGSSTSQKEIMKSGMRDDRQR